jgi:hypothetical protein
MTDGFDYRKELLELREWWEKVHPSTKDDLLRVAKGETAPDPCLMPSTSKTLDEDTESVKDSREQIEDLLWAARRAVEKAILLELGLERRVGELVAKGRKFDELETVLWRPLTMTKRVAEGLKTDTLHLRTFLQELDWAIDPRPNFLEEHLERAKRFDHKDNVAMLTEAMEMHKAWLKSTRAKDDGV